MILESTVVADKNATPSCKSETSKGQDSDSGELPNREAALMAFTSEMISIGRIDLVRVSTVAPDGVAAHV